MRKHYQKLRNDKMKLIKYFILIFLILNLSQLNAQEKDLLNKITKIYVV